MLFGLALVLVFKKYQLRRPVLTFQFFTTGILLTVMAVLIRFEGLAIEIATQACAVIACGLMATSFTCVWLYTSEALPTQFRASGFGILSASCRLGSIIGMQVLKLGIHPNC